MSSMRIWNGTSWVITGLDNSTNIVTSATAPVNPATNLIWFDISTTPSTMKVWNTVTSAWIPVEIGGLNYTAENIANKGIANGYVPLNADIKIASDYLPSLSLASVFPTSSEPLTPSEGDVWVNTDTGTTKIYDADTVTWYEITNSSGYITTVNGHSGPAATVTKEDVSLGNVANVDSTIATNILSGTVPVARLPIATSSTVGVVKAGTNVTIAGDGTLSTSFPTTGVITGGVGATDSAIPRASGTTGAIVKSSLATIDDNGSINIPSGQTYKIGGTALNYVNVGALASNGTAANSTLWASLAMPSVSSATALQVMRLNADKSALEFATVTGGSGTTDHGSLTGLSDDDHPQYIKHSLATALNDILMASGAGVFVKKTIDELKTALGLGAAAYLAVGSSTGQVAAGDHNHSGIYQAVSSLLTSIAGLTLTANGGKVIAVKSDVSGFELITPSTGGDVSTDTIWDAAGDLVVGTGSNTASRLAMGEALQQLRVNATKTELEFATISASATAIIQRSLEGVVYETSLMYWVAPATCTISTAIMSLSSNPSASSTYCKVQVMKNGILETNSIFTSDVPMQITEVTSATNGIYQASGTLDSGQTSLAAGDILHFRVNQADTGCADLLIQVKVNFT